MRNNADESVVHLTAIKPKQKLKGADHFYNDEVIFVKFNFTVPNYKINNFKALNSLGWDWG